MDALPSDRPVVSRDEIAFYSRQLLLPELGVEGQAALRAARVAVIGAGGLGSPVLLYLAAAGVGTLGIVEFDTIDISNLHRQVLFSHADVGRPKGDVAAERVRALNPLIQAVVHRGSLTPENALEVLGGYDVVVDATDNFSAKYVLNDACVRLGIPLVGASILRFDGQVSVYHAGHGPCYRCIFPEPPPPDLAPSCADAGVLGILPGTIGCIQATEAVKLVVGIGTPLRGRLLSFDALAMRFREMRASVDPGCVACGTGATPGQLGLSAPAPQAMPQGEEIEVAQAAQRLAAPDPPFLLDVRNPAEADLARLPGSILIPVGELEDNLAGIPRSRPIICYCHKGARSLRAAALLQRHGFGPVVSMRGGIDAWSRLIDSSIPQY